MFGSSWSNSSLNLAAVAIPAFFLFTGLEYLVAIRQRKNHLFKFDSSIANISIGLAERLLNLFLTASFFGAFQYVYEHYALFNIPNHWSIWIILLLSTDMVWYWYHRLGHEVNLFWAAHIVHHQSEEFNYTVSARITTLQAIVRNVFWCLLPLVGFHPSMVMTMLIVHGTYSFFTHTQMIGKLGWLEYIFITPSHHRVHHASNEKYLNKNYGDLFVFWDKIFGTFQREEEKPSYGLTHPLKSYSFIWQHAHYFMEMATAFRRTKGFWKKLLVIFGKPEGLDQDIRPELEKTYLSHPADQSSRFRYRVYILLQVIFAVTTVFIVTLLFYRLDLLDSLTMLLLVSITLINCGALLEQRTWIYYLEHFRVLVLFAYLSYLTAEPVWVMGAICFSMILLWSSAPVKRWFLEFIYG